MEKLNKGLDELVDYIRSKIEGIEPTYAGAKEDDGFNFRNEYKRPISLVIAKTYISMKYRVGKLKHYEDVKLSDEWASYEPFVKWYLTINEHKSGAFVKMHKRQLSDHSQKGRLLPAI